MIEMSEDKRYAFDSEVGFIDYKKCGGDTLNNRQVVDLLNQKDKRIKELEKENENQNNILEDFMVMLNKLQANSDNEVLQLMAKDMLRMMGKDIIGDLND